MIPDELAKHRAVIDRSFQIAVTHAKHRTIHTTCLICRSWDPGNGIARMTTKHTRANTLLISFHCATSDEHHISFSVVGPSIRVFDGRAAKLAERDDD